MALVLHILLALASVGYATLTYFRPTNSKLNTSQALVGLTIASGTYLVISTRAPLVSACITGLIYLGAVSAALVAAKRKLAKQLLEL